MTDAKKPLLPDITRRDFAGFAAKGLAFGTAFGSYADFARAQENGDDEHFYFFIELRGGIQWMVATDGRDLTKLPLDNPRLCHPLKLTEEPLTTEQYAQVVEGESYRKNTQNGKFILLPYMDDLTSSYKAGQTTLGNPYILGFAAQSLLPYVDDVAVVRGISMKADFHGLANAGGEIFSGLPSPESPHVASVLATMLSQKHGVKLLDNLVFENATFSAGAGGLGMAPVRLDAQSLGYIVGNADQMGAEAAETRYAKARALADALAKTPGLTDLHRKTFESYVGAMTQAPAVRSMLLKLKDELGAVDASLDLGVQIKTAWALMKAGLTRTVTLCLGAPNGKNKVDGFGLFDAHQGVYHINPESQGTVNTQRHHLNVIKAMDVLADFVKQLKSTPYGNNGKTWFDVATVCVGTEFARPSNFMGNEASGSETGTAFGNGHFQYNNNYILFGKGVKGGAWIGQNDPITQMGYQVDMTTVEQDQVSAVQMTPHPMNFEPEQEGANEQEGEGFFSPKDLDPMVDKRPLMAKDVVRTIMGTAGLDGRYGEAYSDPEIANAKALRPLVKS